MEIQPVGKCWIPCRDAVGREAEVLVTISEGDLVVPPSGGTVRFGANQVNEAREYQAAVATGVALLEQYRRRVLVDQLHQLPSRPARRKKAR